jgi:hypothetical protein
MNTKLEKLLEGREELHNEIYNVATMMWKVEDPKAKKTFSHEEIMIDDLTGGDTLITIHWATSFYGDTEYNSCNIPSEYLFNDRAEELHTLAYYEQEHKERIKRDAKRVEQEEEKLKKDHARYLKLKEQFGE